MRRLSCFRRWAVYQIEREHWSLHFTMRWAQAKTGQKRISIRPGPQTVRYRLSSSTPLAQTTARRFFFLSCIWLTDKVHPLLRGYWKKWRSITEERAHCETNRNA